MFFPGEGNASSLEASTQHMIMKSWDGLAWDGSRLEVTKSWDKTKMSTRYCVEDPPKTGTLRIVYDQGRNYKASANNIVEFLARYACLEPENSPRDEEISIRA